MPPRWGHADPGEVPPALRVRGVGIGFRGVRALDSVDFDVPVGGISAVIGPNGAGKTTLFNCISGLYLHEGSIELQGESLNGLGADQRASRGIARTFQTPNLLPETSVLENALLGAHARMRTGIVHSLVALPSVRREETGMRREAMDTLDALGIARLWDRPVAVLPHGDRRRVEIARALLARPRVLLLDEPAAGLGEDEALELLREVERVGAEVGMTCVLVEHDFRLVTTVAHHALVLDAGKVLAVGTPQQVAADPAVIEAYLGTDEGEAA